MKKLICLLAAAALLVCCALPAFAEASGVSRADYTITAYSVDATLHENNTVTQTERITVDFAVPSRGIYRVLPVALWVEKDTADGPQEMAYRARVQDLAVTGEGQTAGAPVETDTEDGFYSIRIGKEFLTARTDIVFFISIFCTACFLSFRLRQLMHMC